MLFIPFIAAFAIDGMYKWKLKRFQFGKVTIQFYRIWLKAFTLIALLISAYLILPNIFIFNNVAQLFTPLACLILGIAIGSKVPKTDVERCMRIFGNKKPKPVPTTVPEVLANESGRFYKMYRLSATSKTLIYVFGIGFMRYSFIFGEGNDDKAKDQIAVVMIGVAMEAGSKTGDGLIIAEAIRDAYKNKHAKAILIQADSGGG